MCGSCSPTRTASSRRRASRYSSIACFLAVLAALAVVAAVFRFQTASPRASGCNELQSASSRYTAAVTRDLRAGPKQLVADTRLFIKQAGFRNGVCPESRTFVHTAHLALDGACARCARLLHRALRI